MGLVVVLVEGCRQPATPSEAPGEPSVPPQPATLEPPEVESADLEVESIDEEDEGDEEDTPEQPTGVAEIDASIHQVVGDSVCLLDTSSGDLDGVDPKDWIARFSVCETGEPLESLVYIVGSGGVVTELEPPSIGGYGGYPEFDRMETGERVLLMRDSCCDTETYGIVHLLRGELVLGVEVMGEDVEVRRDGQGRIVELIRVR